MSEINAIYRWYGVIDVFEMSENLFNPAFKDGFLHGYGYAQADGSGFVDFFMDMVKVGDSDDICPCLIEDIE